jgi:hypothetical protein
MNILNNLKEKFNLKKYFEKDLSDAILDNNIKKVKVILRKLPDKKLQYNYCTYCVINNYIEIIDILLKDDRCIPQSNLNESLLKSIEYDNFEAFKLLISDTRVLKAFDDTSTIKHCIQHLNLKALDYLLNTLKINPFNNNEYCPFCDSLDRHNNEIVKEILGNKYFSIKYYLYSRIVLYNKLNIYKILIETNKMSLNDLFPNNECLETILNYCLKMNNIETLKYLFNIPELQTQLKRNETFYSKIKTSLMQNKIKSF